MTSAAIAYDIQQSAQYINELANSPSYLAEERREKLSQCNKTQLKAIAAELDTVQKRLDWILKGIY